MWFLLECLPDRRDFVPFGWVGFDISRACGVGGDRATGETCRVVKVYRPLGVVISPAGRAPTGPISIVGACPAGDRAPISIVGARPAGDQVPIRIVGARPAGELTTPSGRCPKPEILF